MIAAVRREPAVILSAVQALVLLAVGLGVQWTTDQQGLIFGFAAAALSLITGTAVRAQVSPTTSEGAAP